MEMKETLGEKRRRETYKNPTLGFEQIQEAGQ